MTQSVEREIRRSARFSKMNKYIALKSITTEYIIFNANIRYNVTRNKIEKKERLWKEYICLDNRSIEICYVSQETEITCHVPGLIEYGSLCLKKIYHVEDNLILYSLHYLDNFINDYDKLIIELEYPYQGFETFSKMCFMYKLHYDSIPEPIEGVIETRLPVNMQPKFVLPKIDGYRGRFNVYNSYAIFNGETISFVVDKLHNIWGKELCFSLKNIDFVGEYVKPYLVIIDIANNKINALARFNVILNLAKTVRISIPVTHKSNIIFQGYDVQFIRENISTDGQILIYDKDRIYKRKNSPNIIDLQCFSDDIFLDSDGILYNLPSAVIGVKYVKNMIYECKLICNNTRTITPIKERNDKFKPNSRFTVLNIFQAYLDK